MDHAAYMNGDKVEVVTIEMIENHQVEEEAIKGVGDYLTSAS